MKLQGCKVDDANMIRFFRSIPIRHDGIGAYIQVGRQQVRIINPPGKDVRSLSFGAVKVHNGQVAVSTTDKEKLPTALVLVQGTEITLAKGNETPSGVVDWCALYERQSIKEGVPLSCLKYSIGDQGDVALIAMSRGASIRVADWRGHDHFVAYDGHELVVLPKDHALVRVRPYEAPEPKAKPANKKVAVAA